MNQRGIESERTDKSLSDSGEVLTNLFRNAEATQEIRKRKATRGLDYKPTARTESLSGERDDSGENTSEFGKIRADRTSTLIDIPPAVENRPRQAQIRSPAHHAQTQGSGRAIFTL